jgi:hypothetical protein
VGEDRTEQVMVRMTPSEVKMLEQIAEADGLYPTDVIQLLVCREHELRCSRRASDEQARASQRRAERPNPVRRWSIGAS